MLNEIKTLENAEPYLRSKLERGELLIGFGHRVLKTTDPRAESLRLMTTQLAGKDAWLDLAYVEQAENNKIFRPQSESVGENPVEI